MIIKKKHSNALPKPVMRTLTKEEYIEQTGTTKLKTKTEAKTKVEIFDLLCDFPELNLEIVWTQIINIINKKKKSPTKKNYSSAKEEAYLLQKCLELFDGYILSLWQDNLILDFIKEAIFWFYKNEQNSDSVNLKSLPKEFDLENLDNDANELDIVEMDLNTPLVSYSDLYQEVLFPTRIAVNTQILNQFNEGEVTNFLDLLELEPTTLLQSDLYYFILGYLLHHKFLKDIRPFDKYLLKLYKQKRINDNKLKYVTALQNSITSIFILEHIDQENNIGWLRDIFNSKKLYPVIDLTMTKEFGAIFKVFHAEIIPIVVPEYGAKVYIHTGSTAMYNYFASRDKIIELMESDLSFKEISLYIQELFLVGYNQLKNQYWLKIKSTIESQNFKGDIEVLEKYYLTLKSRSFKDGSINIAGID